MRNRAPSPLGCHSGFTLVEVLVALVITSLIVSVLMGLLFYVYRVQDAIQREVIEREHEFRTRAWFYEVLAGCIPAEYGSGSEFIGSSQEIACDTLSPLRPHPHPAPQRITLTLSGVGMGYFKLTYSQQNDPDKTATDLVTFPASVATFIFYGVTEGGLEQWPPKNNIHETLPRRIRLTVKDSSSATIIDWLAAPRADPWLEPVIKNPFFDLDQRK